MSSYEIVTLILSIVSLIVSGVISFAIFCLGRRIEKKKDDLETERIARKFIINNGKEILYLPYCVMARATNRHHKHIRTIYNEYNALPDNIQEKIIELCEYNFKKITTDYWINEGLQEIEEFISKYDLGKSFLYDGAKYFHRAFEHWSSSKTNRFNEHERLFEDKIRYYSSANHFLGGKITFSQYIESYICKFIFEKNDNEKSLKNLYPKPLDYLNYIKDFHNCDEEELCFWMMVIVEELCMYVIRLRHNGWLNDVKIDDVVSRGDALPETFEDKYYETLMYLHKMHLDKVQYQSKNFEKEKLVK